MKYDTDYFIYINNTKNEGNCQDMNIKIKKIVYISLLVAIFVVIGKFLTIDLGTIKLTIKSLPIYVGAIVLGPFEGAFVGLLGELLVQLTGQYGFTATTLFWTMPYVVVGAICGVAFENKIIKINGGIKYWVFIISLQMLLTFLNTLVIFIDSMIFGYYSFVYVFGSLIVRLMSSILVGIIYSIVLPFMINAIKKIH